MRQMLWAGMLLLGALLVPTAASADTTVHASSDGGLSVGVILGDPTGLTLRSGLGGQSAIQAHLGFSPFPGDAVSLMVDWTYDVWDPLSGNPTLALPLYFGVGGKAQWFTGRYYVYRHNDRNGFADPWNFGLGARALVGLRASLHDAPIDLFVELAPLGLLVVLPSPGIYYDVDAALGARFRL